MHVCIEGWVQLCMVEDEGCLLLVCCHCILPVVTPHTYCSRIHYSRATSILRRFKTVQC